MIGNIILFERNKHDKIAFILTKLLKLFYKNYDGWGWHMGIVASRTTDGNDYWILEATWPTSKLTLLSQMGKYRSYQWLDVINMNKHYEFVNSHIGKKYDILLYPWTTIQYLFRHYWNKPIPRLLDDRFTCWELATEYCEFMGKRMVSKYDCPILPEIVTKLNQSMEE